MNIEQYFAQRDTPSAESPVGATMVRVLKHYPALSFDEARVEAQKLLHKAAKARVYRAPAVRSAEAEKKRQEGFAALNARRAKLIAA